MKGQQLARTSLLWQLLLVVVPVIPHLSHLPLWVPFLLLLCLSWRFMVFQGRWSFPKWYVRAALVVFAAVGVIASYKTGGGISSTVALLVTSFGLKTLELYKKRDAMVIVYVAYLVSSTAFLFNQSFFMAVYVFISLVVCTTSLLTINITKEVNLFLPLKRTVLLMFPAIPLMVVLFLLVPRIGPLWEVGLDRSAAKTGLSEKMSPGDITQLTRSAEIAFRASFTGRVPDQKDLYWRAIVLNDFNGRTWYNADKALRSKGIERQLNSGVGTVQYELILEKSDSKYIPVLEQLKSKPHRLIFNEDMTLNAHDIHRQRSQYQLTSQLTDSFIVDGDLFTFVRQLELPEGNEQTKQLAQGWWDETQEISAFLDKILQNFNQSFVYTLKPPALGTDGIDQFLFESQQGFCGHFSSATAFMLRAVGIPARVVTGYQGGELNPFEGYLLVRQYDAHAWVEYWSEEKGWSRVDPTAYVAPERIEQPSNELLRNEEQFLVDNPVLSASILNEGWMRYIRLRMEAFNYGWQRWVLGYHHQQHTFLSKLMGKITALKLTVFLLVPFALVVIATTLMILRSRTVPPMDPCDKAIFLLSQQLKEQGLQRKPGETVQQYCARIASVRSELSEMLEEIGNAYEELRYAGRTSPERTKKFLVLVIGCRKAI
ncbi:MAG: transglutaminase TgpA family protein [Neptuniibacter sp.]